MRIELIFCFISTKRKFQSNFLLLNICDFVTSLGSNFLYYIYTFHVVIHFLLWRINLNIWNTPTYYSSFSSVPFPYIYIRYIKIIKKRWFIHIIIFDDHMLHTALTTQRGQKKKNDEKERIRKDDGWHFWILPKFLSFQQRCVA